MKCKLNACTARKCGKCVKTWLMSIIRTPQHAIKLLYLKSFV